MNPDPVIVEAALAPRVSGNAVVVAALHLLGLAAAGILPLDAPPLSLLACPFRAMTGLPCLGCGCLHAFAAVAHFDLRGALVANPLGAVAAVGGICFAIATALRIFGVPLALPRVARGQARLARLALPLVVLANWSFVALRVSR